MRASATLHARRALMLAAIHARIIMAKTPKRIEAGLDDKRIVLTRKPGEQISIAIGDTTILVELHSLRARAARLAITAPRSVEIMRGELVAGYEEEGEQT